MNSTYFRQLCAASFFVFSSFGLNINALADESLSSEANEFFNEAVYTEDPVYQTYIDQFEEVFKVMSENYYVDIKREDYDRFIETFNSKIYKELKAEGKSHDFVRWRSAAYLIDFLKQEDDIFSAFYPPKPAKEYEEKVLGKKVDLGIVGDKVGFGFRVSFIEPRSDAYVKGVRENDLIVQVDDQNLEELTAEQINDLLVPLEGSNVELVYLDGRKRQKHTIQVTSQEYFKQTVFNVPIPVDNVYCLQIDRFNRKTSDDLFRHLAFMRQKGPIDGLIIDLRGNPGGPPLAAREISSFFLPAGDEFAYFQKKNQPKALLDVPKIPEEYHYHGPMAILIDNGSGSASELFSGILQRRKRAALIGQNSAGQVFLKSMFHLADESMLLLVTARGHHPDGFVFSFDGLKPNRYISEEEQDDILKYAASYLIYMNQASPENL